jgi:hypothetical protein
VRLIAMDEDDAGNPPVYCDHKPPKVATIRAGGKVRVQCLTCGTVGPARDRPGDAFRALLRVPYRVNKGDMRITCVVTSNRGMKGARGGGAFPAPPRLAALAGAYAR